MKFIVYIFWVSFQENALTGAQPGIFEGREDFCQLGHKFSSLNVKERLPRKRRDIWSLNEYRKYSQRKSIIWPVWQKRWVFVYELNDCGFEYRCCHI